MKLSRDEKALFEAIRKGDTRRAKALLKKGVDAEVTDQFYNTPLEAAIRQGHLPIVKALVEAGADVNRPGDDGDGPLDMAEFFGEKEIARYLKKQGAVKQDEDDSYYSPYGGGTRSPRRGSYDYFDDDDDYYQGGANQRRSAKSAPPKTAAAADKPATPEAKEPAFREETLKDVFNAKNWVGKTEEMRQLWDEVPKKLQKKFDFAAALAEARHETLRQNAAHAPRLAPRKTGAADAPQPPEPKPPAPSV